MTRARVLAVGIVAIVIAIVGLIINARQTAAVFLVAYVAAVSIALGILATIMIANLTNATWFDAWRERALRLLGVMPVLAGLGILVLISLPLLYRWVHAPPPGGVAHYLNVPFFVARFVVYWIAWIAIARALQSGRNVRRVSSAGLVILGVTMTLAAFDWMMSLTPDWFSTIYGVYWFAGGMIGALALLGVLAPHDPDDVHSLAKLLLTFILFWLYIGFAQYIVIWSGGIPREVSWYVPRTRGGWGGVAVLLIFGNFAFPFLALLFRAVKRSRVLVASIGIVLLVLHYVDAFWVVMPGLAPMNWWAIVLAVAMAVIVSGAALVAR